MLGGKYGTDVKLNYSRTMSIDKEAVGFNVAETPKEQMATILLFSKLGTNYILKNLTLRFQRS